MLKNFLEFAKAYKELVFVFTTLMAVVVFFRDYFATKAEVAVLQCQEDNSIAIIESRINTDHITQEIIALTKEIADGESRAKAAKGDGSGEHAARISLDLQLESLKKKLEREDEVRTRAAEKLRPGACEAIAREK